MGKVCSPMARLLGLTRPGLSLPWMSTAAPARMVHADLAVSVSTFGRMLVGFSSSGGSRGSATAAAATPRNPPIIPKRVVVITKTTRYEDESMYVIFSCFVSFAILRKGAELPMRGKLAVEEFSTLTCFAPHTGGYPGSLLDSYQRASSWS